MTKEQFEQLYNLMEKATKEISQVKYVCKNCFISAIVDENGATKQCSCDAPIVVSMESSMVVKASLSN